MSEEQLTALLAKLKEDTGLLEKLKGAGDLDAALVIAKEAGFDVSKADWLKHQARKTLVLSDEELESVAGGMLGGFCSKKNTTCVTDSHPDCCSSYWECSQTYLAPGC